MTPVATLILAPLLVLLGTWTTTPPAPASLAMAPPAPATAPAPLTPTSLALASLATAPPAPATAVWPLDPRPEVVARFDPPAEQWGAGHRGVDLLGRPGQAVAAAEAGTVTFAGTLAGRGVVVVSHGTTRTTYEPVDASVHVGDQVQAGQRIGALGTFGSHCWPRSCLHWGLIRGDTYLDPLTLVGAGPVRLLPLFSAPFGPGVAGRAASGTPAPETPWGWFARPGGVLDGRPGAADPW